MTIEKEQVIITFLNDCNISCNKLEDINNLVIPREILIENTKYDEIKDKLDKFKGILNSSVNTAVQKNAASNQRWPLLNLARQLLKKYDYHLVPRRQANGYEKNGQKKYKRFFVITKSITP
tara:strand:+ start:22188 stop:22550 length:363 start_codon:yes stop_codon:yes gene_type:complete